MERNYKEDRMVKVKWNPMLKDQHLPEIVLVPGFVPDNDIPDYLSDIYGYYIKSYSEIK